MFVLSTGAQISVCDLLALVAERSCAGRGYVTHHATLAQFGLIGTEIPSDCSVLRVPRVAVTRVNEN